MPGFLKSFKVVILNYFLTGSVVCMLMSSYCIFSKGVISMFGVTGFELGVVKVILGLIVSIFSFRYLSKAFRYDLAD